MDFQTRVAQTTSKMPAVLTEILAAELAAGNEIAELEHGEVSGSVVVRLHYAFRRLPAPLPTGIVYSERTDTDPMAFECGTDDGLWTIRFAKFKPIALPSLTDGPDPRFEHVAAMETVRAREAALKNAETLNTNKESVVQGTHQFTEHFGIEADFRGETIRYTEGGRYTQMMWTWAHDYSVYPDTTEPWHNADGTSSPMSESERATVLKRVLKYGLDEQGVKMKVL